MTGHEAGTEFSPLAMMVMGLLAERPMHPYEIAMQMRHRHMDESISLNYGTLYHCVSALLKRAAIEPEGIEREGRRPERTVYRLTERGREEFLTEVQQLISQPVREVTRFGAGLCLAVHLEASSFASMLRQRAGRLDSEASALEIRLRSLWDAGLARAWLLDHERDLAARREEAHWARQIAGELEAGSLAWLALGASPAKPAGETE